MTTNEERDAALEQWASDPSKWGKPSNTLTGEAAAAHGRATLLAATEDDPEGRALVERAIGGRPTLDDNATAGPSPLWQVRAPRDLDAALRRRAQIEGRTFSDVLRDAGREYLASHPA